MTKTLMESMLHEGMIGRTVKRVSKFLSRNHENLGPFAMYGLARVGKVARSTPKNKALAKALLVAGGAAHPVLTGIHRFAKARRRGAGIIRSSLSGAGGVASQFVKNTAGFVAGLRR